MCRRNQKLSSCQRTGEAVSGTAQTKNLSSVKLVAAVSGTADCHGVTATPDFSEYLNCESGRTNLGATDDIGRNSGLESEEPRTDGTGVLLKPVPHLQTDATTAASSIVDNLSPDGTPSEGNPADKVERLRKTIDHAAGQLYTIADVYLMMMKPSRVPLEYDWVDTSADNVVTDDVSGKLRKLVCIAKAAFTASAVKRPVGSNTNTTTFGFCSGFRKKLLKKPNPLGFC